MECEHVFYSVTVDVGDGPDTVSNYSTLLPRGKRHDYFTSCLPFAQKGTAVTIGLSGTADVWGIRRRLDRAYRNEAALGDQISRSLRRAQDTAALWNKENHTHHGSLTELNFRANPSAFYDHYSALKNASLIHQKSVRREQYYPGSMNVDQLYEFGKQDVHTIPVNGISIEDIEAMHPPLSMDNLTAISKVFRKPFLKKPTKEQDFAETTLILLATLPQAQPEKASKIPRNIQNLTEVTQDFFDYYISFLKNGFEDSADELEYLNSLFLS